MVEQDDFIDAVIPEEKIGTGPDDGLDHDFRAGCGSYVAPNNLVGSLRTSTTTFT